jgi:hypothetical protein
MPVFQGSSSTTPSIRFHFSIFFGGFSSKKRQIGRQRKPRPIQQMLGKSDSSSAHANTQIGYHKNMEHSISLEIVKIPIF